MILVRKFRGGKENVIESRRDKTISIKNGIKWKIVKNMIACSLEYILFDY